MPGDAIHYALSPSPYKVWWKIVDGCPDELHAILGLAYRSLVKLGLYE